MNQKAYQALSVFSPFTLKAVTRLREEKIRLVHYTSADAALSILSNENVWLRNTQCMNDFSEVQHGFDCLKVALRKVDGETKFQKCVNALFPGTFEKLVEIFDSWMPIFENGTYIVCVSEHSSSEDRYGRLSMWRAYGCKAPVALVLNSDAFLSESDALSAYALPVEYLDVENFSGELDSLADRIESHRDYIESLGKDQFLGWLFWVFRKIVLTVKHPGFSEEKEWRIVYLPDHAASERIEESIEVIGGIPQKIQKISLKDIPEEGLVGIEIPRLLERIIIGPNDFQGILRDTFVDVLKRVGVEDARERVLSSGIPLRT